MPHSYLYNIDGVRYLVDWVLGHCSGIWRWKKFRGRSSRSQFSPGVHYPRWRYICLPNNADKLQKHWLFIGLSNSLSDLDFLKRATKKIRFKLWKRIISALNNLRCFQRLQVLPWNSAYARRLKADLEIQDMLFEYNTLVLSQAYFISYQLRSFNVATEPLLYEFLKRTAIGVLIEFIFNCLSNFVQIYYYNIPIGRVWKKYWKRHL